MTTDDDSSTPDRRTVLQRTAGDGERTTARRSVLRGTLAAAAAAVGFTGAAAALDPSGGYRARQLRGRYSSRAAATAALESHGADVLDLLADEGYLAEASVADLADPEVNTVHGPDGDLSAHVRTELRTDDARVSVVVEPEAGRQYAVVTFEDGGSTVYDPDTDDVEPQCIAGYGCDGGGCQCTSWEMRCCNGYCYKDSVHGTCYDCSACATDPCQYGC